MGSLTGLTQGHFPVHAKARYADDIDDTAIAKKRMKKGQNAALPVTSSSTRRGINVFAKAGSPVIAVQDGKIVKMGRTDRLGKFIQLRDVYGNTYTYAHLKKLSLAYPVPKEKTVSKAQVKKELHLAAPAKDPKPTAPASAGTQVKDKAPAAAPGRQRRRRQRDVRARQRHRRRPQGAPVRQPQPPGRLQRRRRGAAAQRRQRHPGLHDLQVLLHRDLRPQALTTSCSRSSSPAARSSPAPSSGASGAPSRRWRRTCSSRSARPAAAPRASTPSRSSTAGSCSESTAIYRAAGKNPFWGPDSKNPSIGQILLMSKEALQHRVLTDPAIDIYACGRRDIQSGGIDRRVLATLEFLSASGLKPTVSALHCGHSFLTTSGNVSEHSSGNAVDIAAINGIPILGHQGPGSITDITIRRLLTLQGTMKPHQIISLMTFDGADNTLSLPDHNDHIHVGFQPLDGTDAKANRQLNSALKPSQWTKLMGRLSKIDNPTVPLKPSKYALKVPKRASKAHVGE